MFFFFAARPTRGESRAHESAFLFLASVAGFALCGLSGAWKGTKITQLPFCNCGKADVAPGFLASWVTVEIDGMGHWVQHEASEQVSDEIVKFVPTVSIA